MKWITPGGEGYLAMEQKEGTMTIDGRSFDPVVVASTLLHRRDDTGSVFRLRDAGETFVLEGPTGEVELDRRVVEAAEPDPLWASAASICAHMENDHRDTFPLFLRSRGREGVEPAGVSMPWVDRAGFLLANRSEVVWIAFPEDCPTPELVRKSMIKMLREIRHE